MSGHSKDIKYFNYKIDLYRNRIKWLHKQIRKYNDKVKEYDKARHDYLLELSASNPGIPI